MKKPVQRRVNQVSASGQIGLVLAVPCEDGVESASSSAGQVVFNDPDPAGLYVSDVPLAEHLKRCGIGEVFVIRDLLQQESWSDFESAYRPGGRPPYSPRAMMGLILYGVLKGDSSLRELEKLARVDLGCWWLTGGIMPDHSVIGRFIQQHESRLTEAFFESLTRRVLNVTESSVVRLAGDGTVVEAAASRYNTVKREALEKQIAKARAKRAALNDTAHAADSAITRAQTDLEQLLEAEQQLRQREAKRRAHGKDATTTRINPREPDGVIQPLKRGGMGTSYKPSVLANDQRIVVSYALEGSSETRVVEPMLESAKAYGEVSAVLLDAGYFCDSVLQLEQKQSVELLIPEGQTSSPNFSKKQSDKKYPKKQFHYDNATDSYRCPADQRLTPVSRNKGNEATPASRYTVYATQACVNCSQRHQCTTRAKGRQIKRYPGDERKEAMRVRFEQPATRERYQKRAAWVEPVFSQLKERQGLNRFRRKGLAAVRLEFAIHVLAYNLGRAVALTLGYFCLIGRLSLAISGIRRALKAERDFLALQLAKITATA